MQIVFRQSGGLLGTSRECDTANLAEPVAREAKELFNRAHVHELLDQGCPAARDAARYELTVIDGNKVKHIVTDDASLPAELVPLIDLLRQHSRPIPPKKRGTGD
jgi:hypothetical protein